MKQISLLLLLAASTAFGQPKTDPYFIKTQDTVATHGPISIVRNMLEDKKGNLWFATFQGIMKYDGKVFTNYTLKENLIHFHVYSVMEDKHGNIWFGTYGGGAYKYDGKTFTLITTNDGLADDEVNGLLEDKTGNIWFATEKGLSCFDTLAPRRTVTTISGMPLTSRRRFTNYTTQDGLGGNRANLIIQDKTGKFWIATRSGVSCYDGKFFTDFRINQRTPFTNVRTIKEGKDGKIWIGGADGLYAYDPNAQGESQLTKVMSNFINYVIEDQAGNLWLTTKEEKGMALYKYDNKSFVKIIEKKEGDAQIFEITEDKNANIWFGTMSGCCRYDGKTFTYFR